MERLNIYMDQKSVSNGVNLEWNELKGLIIQATSKVSRRHKKNIIKGAYGVRTKVQLTQQLRKFL
jgi:hypothetical protein